MGRARELVRRRVLRLRGMAVPIVQCAVAAALAWLVAGDVLGHERPFFAPIAVVICIGAGFGQRLRRMVELVVGVSVGVGVGDVLVATIGTGPWQLALVVALAMAVAVLVDSGPLITLQAASSAVLVVTLLPPSGTGGVDRMLDALVGGVLGLAAIALIPGNPPGIAHRFGQRMLDEFAAVLTGAAEAAERRDEALAARTLSAARAGQRQVDEYRAALVTAGEIVALSPVRRRQRHRLAGYLAAATPVDHALRNTRVLLRRVAAALRAGEPIPPAVPEALRRLAGAAVSLGRELPVHAEPTDTRAELLAIAETLDANPVTPLGFSTRVVLAQLRSITVDLLQATGISQQEARAALPPVVA